MIMREATLEDIVVKHCVSGRYATDADGYDTVVSCVVSTEVKGMTGKFISTTGYRTTGKGVRKVDGLLHENLRKIYGVLSGGEVHANMAKNSGGDFEVLPITPFDAVETHVICCEESTVTVKSCYDEEVVRVVENVDKVV